MNIIIKEKLLCYVRLYVCLAHSPADKERFSGSNVATKEIGDVCTQASANGHQRVHVIYYLYVNTSSLSFL